MVGYRSCCTGSTKGGVMLAVMVFGGRVPNLAAIVLLVVAVVAFLLAAFTVVVPRPPRRAINLIGLGLAAFAGVFLWAVIAAAAK